MAKKENEEKQTQSKTKKEKDEKKKDNVDELVSDEKKEGAEMTKEEKKEIQVIERIIENKEIAPADVFGKLDGKQINLIKRTIAKGANDDELRLFVQVCKGANLNPFLRQAFLIPRWDSKEGKEIRTIQVSIDGFRSIAESSGAYAGNEDPVFDGENTITYGKDNKSLVAPEKAMVTVYKIVNGERYPFTATARWNEYYPGPKLGFQWHIRPYLMLGKCAEALALRKAFPKLLSGMYAQEEMDKTMEVDSDAEKRQFAYNKLLKAIKLAKLEELYEYKERMEASDSYSNDQKKEYLSAVDERIKELAEKELSDKPQGTEEL